MRRTLWYSYPQTAAQLSASCLFEEAETMKSLGCCFKSSSEPPRYFVPSPQPPPPPPPPSYLLRFGEATSGDSGGFAGIGYVLSDPNGNLIKEFSARFAHNATTNIAAYKALLAGLQYASELQCIDTLRIKGTPFVAEEMDWSLRGWRPSAQPDHRIDRYNYAFKELSRQFNQLEIESAPSRAKPKDKWRAEQLAYEGIEDPCVHLDAREVLKHCSSIDNVKKYVLKNRHQGTDVMTFILDVISGSNPVCFEAIEEMCRSQVLDHCKKRESSAGRTLQISCRGGCELDGHEGIRRDFVCMSCLLSFR